MADLIKEANWLRFYYQSDDAVKDKDLLKDKAFLKSSSKIDALFLVPFGFQLWQLSLINHEASLSLYKKVRYIKTFTFWGALVLGSFEILSMQKQWTFYNRFYPEPTEL